MNSNQDSTNNQPPLCDEYCIKSIYDSSMEYKPFLNSDGSVLVYTKDKALQVVNELKLNRYIHMEGSLVLQRKLIAGDSLTQAIESLRVDFFQSDRDKRTNFIISKVSDEPPEKSIKLKEIFEDAVRTLHSLDDLNSQNQDASEHEYNEEPLKFKTVIYEERSYEVPVWVSCIARDESRIINGYDIQPYANKDEDQWCFLEETGQCYELGYSNGYLSESWHRSMQWYDLEGECRL